jgi:cysteine-rich repeat protein
METQMTAMMRPGRTTETQVIAVHMEPRVTIRRAPRWERALVVLWGLSLLSGVQPALAGATCGDGRVDPGETCDDGNQKHADLCPANCMVEACEADEKTTHHVDVSFAPPAGGRIGGLTLLVDFPEGKVTLPGAPGPPVPDGVVTGVPEGSLSIPVHLGHALRVTVARRGALVAGPIFRVRFQGCRGASPPSAADFSCTALEATDDFANPVAGVTCTVTGP